MNSKYTFLYFCIAIFINSCNKKEAPISHEIERKSDSIFHSKKIQIINERSDSCEKKIQLKVDSILISMFDMNSNKLNTIPKKSDNQNTIEKSNNSYTLTNEEKSEMRRVHGVGQIKSN